MSEFVVSSIFSVGDIVQTTCDLYMPNGVGRQILYPIGTIGIILQQEEWAAKNYDAAKCLVWIFAQNSNQRIGSWFLKKTNDVEEEKING